MSDVVNQARSTPEQDDSIYSEGTVVYAKHEGEGRTKLWIEEARNGVYILREDEKEGEKVMWDKKFAEEDLKEVPWTTDSK